MTNFSLNPSRPGKIASDTPVPDPATPDPAMPSKTLLITGISGLLGWNLAHLARDTWQVVGIYWAHPVQVSQTTAFRLDLTDAAALRHVMESIKPDAVMHLAALSKPNLCETEPDLSHKINVVATEHLATLCAEAKIPFVFTSSDMVFDGKQAPYREQDLVTPVNRYGEHKAEAERRVLVRHPEATVCRMPLMYGRSPAEPNFLQQFVRTLHRGEPLRLFVDEFRTPVSGQDGAAGLLQALESATTGLLHLGGQERLSRYDFGVIMAQVLSLPLEQLHPCHQTDVPMAAARPSDVSLTSDRARTLGYHPRVVAAALAEMRSPQLID